MPKALEDMSLAELFAESDRIADRYLDPADIAARDAELAAIDAEVRSQCRQPITKMRGAIADLKALKAKCDSLILP